MQQNLEASAKHGVDNLVYTFYDRGYSALNEGIQNLKNMSAALLVMGVTGKKCRDICLTGILILLLMRTVPGGVAGMAVSERVDIGDMGQEDFNRKYSNLGLMAKVEIDLSGQNQGNLAVSCMMGRLVLGVGISGVKARNILKREPLYLVEDERAGK